MEQADGNVQLFLFWAESPGGAPTERRITQRKYSLHLSPNSPEFNLLKGTVRNDLGEVSTTTFLTDAVKSRVTFAPLFQANFTDLVSEIHNAKFPEDELVHSLCELDPKESTLVIAIFIGHPDAKFDVPADGRYLVSTFNTENFQIVILTSLLNIPAPKICIAQNRVTYRPELIGPGSEAAVRDHMRGDTPAQGIEMYLRSLYAIRSSIEDYYYSLADNEAEYQKMVELFNFLRSKDVA
jgi:hypothetical protein